MHFRDQLRFTSGSTKKKPNLESSTPKPAWTYDGALEIIPCHL